MLGELARSELGLPQGELHIYELDWSFKAGSGGQPFRKLEVLALHEAQRRQKAFGAFAVPWSDSMEAAADRVEERLNTLARTIFSAKPCPTHGFEEHPRISYLQPSPYPVLPEYSGKTAHDMSEPSAF